MSMSEIAELERRVSALEKARNDDAVLEGIKELQRTLAVSQSAMLETVRYIECVDRRVDQLGQRIGEQIAELKDDFSVILKSEIKGAFTNFEMRLEAKLDARFDAVEERLAALEQKNG